MTNLATTAPPEVIEINGKTYPADTDYRTWIRVNAEMRELVPGECSDEDVKENLLTIVRIEHLIFGGVVKEPWQHVLEGIRRFIAGYPKEDNGHTPEAHEPVYDFEHDLNMIILAIRNQSGLDLSYQGIKPFHWWLFLLEFEALSGEHRILERMRARSYDGKDKDMLKAKRAMALPRKLTRAAERAGVEADDIFYNT